MADMVVAKATNSQVKALAADIKQAQDPEISQLTGWLNGWGQPVPTSAMTGMGGSSMGGMGTGMLSAAGMATLHAAGGSAFDRMWFR